MPDIRQASADYLASSLEQVGGANGGAQDVARRIEEAVFAQHQGDSGNAYRNQMRTLALDLSKNNPELGKRVLQGAVQPTELVSMDPEALKSEDRADADEELKEQALRDARGQEKIPVYATDDPGETEQQAANRLGVQGEVSAQEASMGEEGDFKQRGQPKIHGLEGIEFENGM